MTVDEALRFWTEQAAILEQRCETLANQLTEVARQQKHAEERVAAINLTITAMKEALAMERSDA